MPRLEALMRPTISDVGYWYFRHPDHSRISRPQSRTRQRRDINATTRRPIVYSPISHLPLHSILNHDRECELPK